jgi:cell division septum initiation protein DivIVA
MIGSVHSAFLRFGRIVAVACFAIGIANAQQAATASVDSKDTGEVVKALDQLIEQNRQLEQQTQQLQKQNAELMQQINKLRNSLATQPTPTEPQGTAQPPAPANQPETAIAASSAPVESQSPANLKPEKKQWGEYVPNFGYKVVSTDKGEMSISIYTYARYLNQKLLAPSTTNAFGQTVNVNQRQDAELNKLQIKFLGWVLNPKLRYFLYAWTNNAAQGSQFYIALAGWTGFQFSKQFGLYGGINGIPGTRSLEGNFPFWLSVDSRHIADEFFRPSYSQGFWAKGDIGKFRYTAMIANNLSTLGVQASQFPGNFNTFSGALVWMPSTGEFGQGFGDFENHSKIATRLGAHFSRSNENKQSQPETDAFENTQIRLTDGTIIFTPNVFGPGVTVTDVRYRMSSFDGGIKYRGNALEAEYFMRWLDDYKGPGVSVVPNQSDHGFQVQGSTMLKEKTLQLYLGASKIYGDFGKPWDARLGTNYFPFKNRVFRWNNELLYLSKSPVGYTAVPFAVGGKGWVYHTNFELAF